jgi:hypothetical protein
MGVSFKKKESWAKPEFLQAEQASQSTSFSIIGTLGSWMPTFGWGRKSEAPTFNIGFSGGGGSGGGSGDKEPKVKGLIKKGELFKSPNLVEL